jgi:hypothetical protein
MTVVSRLVRRMANGAVCMVGNQLITVELLKELLSFVKTLPTYNRTAMPMRECDLARPPSDPMDPSGFFRFATQAVLDALRAHPNYDVKFKGLAFYCEFCKALAAINFGSADMALEEVVEIGGFVIGCLRTWHHYLDITSSLSVYKNGLTPQTRADVEIMVACAINLLTYCTWQGLPVDLRKLVRIVEHFHFINCYAGGIILKHCHAL